MSSSVGFKKPITPINTSNAPNYPMVEGKPSSTRSANVWCCCKYEQLYNDPIKHPHQVHRLPFAYLV